MTFTFARLTTRLVSACLLMGAAACQPGSSGALDPARGQVKGDEGPYGGDSVRIQAQGLVVDVSGSWTTRLGANTIDLAVTYRNDGRPVAIDPIAFHARVGSKQGEVAEVVDTTGVDLTDDRTDNDDARTVVETHRHVNTGPVVVAPGQVRTLQISLPFPDGTPAFDRGQPATADVPTGAAVREARFTMAR